MHIHDDETWSTRTGWIPISIMLTSCIPGGGWKASWERRQNICFLLRVRSPLCLHPALSLEYWSVWTTSVDARDSAFWLGSTRSQRKGSRRRSVCFIPLFPSYEVASSWQCPSTKGHCFSHVEWQWYTTPCLCLSLSLSWVPETSLLLILVGLGITGSLRSALSLHTYSFENSPFVYKTSQFSLFWVGHLFSFGILINQGLNHDI